MSKDLIYEIEWRKILVKRLTKARTVLRKDATEEDKRKTEAKRLAAGYINFEEVHEAYGWGDISEKQLNVVKAILESKNYNQSAEALKRLIQIINSIEGELKMLINDPDYREEVITEEEAIEVN